jgi:predicted ATPase
MDHTEPVGASRGSAARPHWSGVLRALRQARGVTVDGWGARLGVSGGTVKRWERGERVPDPGAEAALIAYCREAGLLRRYDHGPLAGLDFSAELLRDLLAEARWRVGGAPAGRVPTGDPPADVWPDAAPLVLPHPSPSALSPQLTSFVGRQREIAVVRRLQAGTRLLTLTGVGGCGKTRLTLALAEELLWAYPHGVWLVDLAALADPELVPPTVAAALGLRTVDQQPVTEALVAFLRPRHLLLVLDNCEHLLAACAELVEVLLRACPNVEILATSREPLGVRGEAVWRVPPMELPPMGWTCAEQEQQAGDGAQLPAPDSTPDSVRLFLERARLHRSDFQVTPHNAEAVANICRRLDGLPLALELAAARVRVLSPDQIAARLGDRFQLLTGGDRTALPRHQTLRATIDWSHDLLTTSEQGLFRRLSVFAGGFTLEAAEAVCGSGQRAPQSSVATPSALPAGEDVLDLFTHLVDKSLVIADERGGEVRYRMLETVRQYGGDKLEEAGEVGVAHSRHSDWCLALVQSAEDAFDGSHEPVWLARLDLEHDNLRAALAWSLRRGESETALRLTGALPHFWARRGYLHEGRQWLAQALMAGAEAPAAVRAKALLGAGVLAEMIGDFAATRSLSEESLCLYQQLEDGEGIARAQARLARILYRCGDLNAARAHAKASLALCRELGHKLGIASAQGTLGLIALRQGDHAAARTLIEARLAINHEQGNSDGIADALDDLAGVAAEQGDAERQAALLEESLALWRKLGNRGGIALALGGLGMAAWARGDSDRALILLQEGTMLYRELGDGRGIARLLSYQGTVVLYRREYAQAEILLHQSLTLHREMDDTWSIGRFLPVLAAAAFGQGQSERSARLAGAAAALRERLGTPLPPAVLRTHDRMIEAVRARLGDVAFERAWAAGRRLSVEEAVATALSDASPA